MSDKAWEDLIDLIDTKYAIDSSKREELPLDDEPKLKQVVESIFFEKDNIKYKIERIVGPRIVDKKTFYSGQGVANHSKYVYDPTESSSRVVFYRQLPDGNFNEITPDELMANS